MNRLTPVLVVAAFWSASPTALAGDKEDVQAVTRAWAEGMSAHDAERVLALYAPDAVLWGTRSPTIRTDPAKVREYFGILKTVPDSYKAVLGEQHVRVYGDMAINSGSYTFSQIENGKEVLRPARFSFVFRKNDGRWLIVDHHSSAVPQPTPVAPPSK
jgi:uncharacterized protein (TIGR02246 family)